MRILVLDDQVIEVTNPEMAEHEIVQVLDEDRFYTQLYNHDPWDEVWLDHDLGIQPHNGRMVTQMIAWIHEDGSMPDPMVTQYRVISNNPVAGDTMVKDLQSCGFNVVRTPIIMINGVIRGDDFRDPQEGEG